MKPMFQIYVLIIKFYNVVFTKFKTPYIFLMDGVVDFKVFSLILSDT
jgi:hypothetical protein